MRQSIVIEFLHLYGKIDNMRQIDLYNHFHLFLEENYKNIEMDQTEFFNILSKQKNVIFKNNGCSSCPKLIYKEA